MTNHVIKKYNLGKKWRENVKMDKHNGVTKEMMTMMIMVKKVPWVMKNMEKIIFVSVFYRYEQDWGLAVSHAL